MQLDFNTLAPKHRANLLALAFNFTRRKDAAEDLVQDAYIRAFTFWPNFSPVSEDLDRDVKVWLRRILSNIFYSQCLKEKRRATAMEEYNMHLEMDTPFFSDDKVSHYLSKLKPEYQEIVKLHYVDGLSYHDLAERLQIPFTKVQKRLWRARQEFKEMSGYHTKELTTEAGCD